MGHRYLFLSDLSLYNTTTSGTQLIFSVGEVHTDTSIRGRLSEYEHATFAEWRRSALIYDMEDKMFMSFATNSGGYTVSLDEVDITHTEQILFLTAFTMSPEQMVQIVADERVSELAPDLRKLIQARLRGDLVM